MAKNAKKQAPGQQTCPGCGMPQEEWRGNNGQGFQMGEKTYCCQGCATGTGCTCR
jgi:hypothetical protein